MELRIARQIARLTQKQLGDLAGIDDSQISLIETGARDIGGMGYYAVVRIARALAPGVPVDKLFPVPDVAQLPAASSEQAVER